MSPDGVVLFGDESGRFAVTLMGLGDFKFSWMSTGGVSSFTRKLVVGGNHHVASTWQDGEQKYYLDGQLVLVDDRPGTMTIRDGEPPAAIRLGSDVAGVDVTLGEPTIWVGHVLSPEEVANLASRDLRPREVASRSIAMRWSLAGPDGKSARTGDVGLSDASGGKHDLASIEGTAPAYRGSVMAAALAAHVGSVQVAPSGRSIVVAFLDSTGALAPVQSLHSTNDSQAISITGKPANSSVSLGFGGQTTPAIPYALGPPVTSLVFSCPITPGTYDIQISWPYQELAHRGITNYTTQATYQIFDDQNLLGTVVCNQQTAPSGFTDPYPSNTSDNFGNYPNPWQPAGTFTFARTTFNAFLSAPTGSNSVVGGTVRIQPHGSTDGSLVRYLCDTFHIAPGVPPNTLAIRYGNWSANYDQLSYSPEASIVRSFLQATPTGTANTASLSASAIQSALQALPNVLANSVAVSSTSPTSVGVLFGGPMGDAPQPTIVSSDTALTVYHDGTNGSFVGGQNPSISINGGASIPLKLPIWGVSSPYQHYIVYPLPQATASPQFLSAGVGMFSRANTGDGNWTRHFGAGYLGANGVGVWTKTSPQPGDSATFPFQGLSPGTYRVAATWTAAAGNCAGARFTLQDGSGNTLTAATFDQTTIPADFNDGGTGWKTIGTFTTTALASDLNVVVSFGTQSGTLIADTVRIDLTSSTIPYVVVHPSDVVTFSATAGFVTTTAGVIPAQSAIAVSNLAGGTLLPPVPSSATMRVGYDIEGEQNLGLIPIYANLAHRNNWGANYVTLNSDGYPVTDLYNVTDCLLSSVPDDVQGLGRGLPNVDAGTYTLMWDGPATTTIKLLSGGTTTATENLSAASITGTTNNKRVFDVEDPYFFSPQLVLRATSTTQNPDRTWTHSFSNLRLYPPGVNPSSAPLFHPALLDKVRGFHCLRFLDPLGTNGSGVVEYSDFGSRTNLSYLGAGRTGSAVIASVGPDTSPKFYDTNRGSVMVTTASPHGFPDGAQVSLNGTIGTSHFASGATVTLDNYSNLVAHVLTPTTFIVGFYLGNGKSETVTNTLTPAGATCSTTYNGNFYAGSIFFEDCITLCSQAGADMWVNVPLLASDACVTAMATAIATGLKSGLKVHVEYSNECWNYSFPQWAYCYGKSHLQGYNDFSYYYVQRAIRVHSLFVAAFVAAGRPASDVRRVLGTQGTSTGVASAILDKVTLFGATFDEIAIAPYFGNDNPIHGSESSLIPIYDTLTVDQLLDLMEMNTVFGGLSKTILDLQATLQAAGFGSVQIVTYEGGVSGIIPFAITSSPNHSARTHAGMRHPRMFGIQIAYNQSLQAGGCALFNHFYLAGSLGDLGGYIQNWSVYEGLNEAPGTGSVTTDAANVSSPENIPAIKSERGGAMRAWQSLVGPLAPIKPVIVASRNVKPKAFGYPAT